MKKRGLTVIEMMITTVLIGIVAYIGTKLTIDYNEQLEWGNVISTSSSSAINALDSIENELVQASASSITLSDTTGSGGYRTIEFPKVIGYNTVSKYPIIDLANAIRFILECNTNKCALNKYIINKTITPATIVNGPITIADNVSSFAVQVVSEYTYKVYITVQKSYPDGKTVSSTYERTIYARNK